MTLLNRALDAAGIAYESVEGRSDGAGLIIDRVELRKKDVLPFRRWAAMEPLLTVRPDAVVVVREGFVARAARRLLVVLRGRG